MCLQGSEMRDALLGHLFGLAAVVRAGRVTEEAPALRMAALLLKLAGKKVFLREVAASVLLQLAGERQPSALPRSNEKCPLPTGTAWHMCQGSGYREAPQHAEVGQGSAQAVGERPACAIVGRGRGLPGPESAVAI